MQFVGDGGDSRGVVLGKRTEPSHRERAVAFGAQRNDSVDEGVSLRHSAFHRGDPNQVHHRGDMIRFQLQGALEGMSRAGD